jgi:hypothetical protein
MTSLEPHNKSFMLVTVPEKQNRFLAEPERAWECPTTFPSSTRDRAAPHLVSKVRSIRVQLEPQAHLGIYYSIPPGRARWDSIEYARVATIGEGCARQPETHVSPVCRRCVQGYLRTKPSLRCAMRWGPTSSPLCRIIPPSGIIHSVFFALPQWRLGTHSFPTPFPPPPSLRHHLPLPLLGTTRLLFPVVRTISGSCALRPSPAPILYARSL